MRRLGRRVLDAGYVSEDQGTLRLVFPTPTRDDYLLLAFDEIRQFGSTSVHVMRRLRSALVGVMESVTERARAQALGNCARSTDPE